MENYHDKICKSVKTFLGRWSGGVCQLIQLTMSHKTLLILITKPNTPGNLLLCCYDPYWINAPTLWNDCALELRLLNSDPNKEPIFQLIDPSVGAEIKCGGFEAKENVKV